MKDFRLPSLGADMDDGTLIEWKVQPGQAVHKGDVIAVVDTSKAAVDIEVWDDAVVAELLTPVGERIAVGTVMARLTGVDERRAAAPPVRPSPPTPTPTPTPPARAARDAERPRASPAARALAAERGLSLAGIAGSGPDGAVLRRDVERRSVPADRQAEMRRVIAAAMSRAKREIPHYYLGEPVPLQTALAWLQARNAAQPVTARMLPVVLLIKATALAAQAMPEFNGWHRDGRFEPLDRVHVGVAIALRGGGLVAPALHDVPQRPLDALMQALDDLVQRARAGRLRASELADPTITVTHLGDQGVGWVHGVIYPPQVALVGFGRIAERAWAQAGQVSALPVTDATLAADHRVSDGHRGALFLRRLRDLLQQPEALDEAG